MPYLMLFKHRAYKRCYPSTFYLHILVSLSLKILASRVAKPERDASYAPIHQLNG